MVITAAAQGAVADVAARRAPAVVVPRLSPHAAQQHLASELDRMGLAVPGPLHWQGRAEGPVDWAGLVDAARRLPSRWEAWATDGAVGRAADLLEHVGRAGVGAP